MANTLHLSLDYISLGKKLVWHPCPGQAALSPSRPKPIRQAVLLGWRGTATGGTNTNKLAPFPEISLTAPGLSLQLTLPQPMLI